MSFNFPQTLKNIFEKKSDRGRHAEEYFALTSSLPKCLQESELDQDESRNYTPTEEQNLGS